MKVAREITDFKLQEKTYLDHQMLLEVELNELKKDQTLAADKNAVAHLDFLDTRINEIQKQHNDFKSSNEPLPLRSWEITAQNLRDNGYHDWIRLSPEEFASEFGDEDRKAYEQFVRGYLTYFENTINKKDNNPVKKYTIYFDWGKTNEEYPLIIYIRADQGLDYPYYDDYAWNPNAGKEVTDGSKITYTGAGSVVRTDNSPFPPPPSMTDPQPPPPPPKGK